MDSDESRRQRQRLSSRSRSLSPRRRGRSRSPRCDRCSHASESRDSTPDAVLPAAAHREELLAALRSHQVVICVGETGSGKTTQIPQYLLASLKDEPLDRVVITQPRRVATISVAQRVAHEMGFSQLAGSPVGYSIRFDDQTSVSTKLKFVTDGVLVRECLGDPTLSSYAVVMLDEAHERSLHTDILFGLLKRVLTSRHDLKLLVTSATLDADRFAAFFANGRTRPPVVQIPGRVFPVDIFHSKQTQVMGLRGPLSTYVRSAVETTLQIHHSEEPGHILLFLTGQHEIEDACAQIRRLHDEHRGSRRLSDRSRMGLRVLPLYGALSGRAQRAIFDTVPSQVRKVIVATNIAETSLTINGVKYVVDCGFTKQKVYNTEKQLESLVVVPISKVSAQQRAGRAGRTAPGKCFRLYSKESYEHMLDESIPEIRRTNLANTVLYLKTLGIHNVLAFDLLDAPEEDSLLDALKQLYVLDAIDAQGHVTTMGKLMAQFPLEPKLSRALIEAVALDCGDDMATIVSMMSSENVFMQPNRRKQEENDSDELPSRDELMLALAKQDLIDDRGDQLTYLNLFNAFDKLLPRQRQQWCETYELRYRALSTAGSIRRQLHDIIASLPSGVLRSLREAYGGDPQQKRSRTTRLRRSICAGFFQHAVRRCNLQSSVYRPVEMKDEHPGGTRVELLHLHPLSALNYVDAPMFCVYHELVATSRPYIRDVVEVEERWVRECAKGKLPVSLDQLYALSGVRNPVTQTSDSTLGQGDTSTRNGNYERHSVSGENIIGTSKRRTIDAARERYLARKKQSV